MPGKAGRAVARGALIAAVVATGPVIAPRARGQAADPPTTGTIVLARGVRDSINAIFVRFNQHWDELRSVNTLTQMLGTGHPTQLEYMGCLVGHASGDTVWVTSWAHARNLRQLQFAVTGDCTHVRHFVGSWHTHPFRADPAGGDQPLKVPALSAADLSTFAGGHDRVVIAAWDKDSIDAAYRAADGTVRHPAPIVVR